MSKEIVEPDNSIASETISNRLVDVTSMVESLEKIFKETQDELCLSDPESVDSSCENKQQTSDVSRQLQILYLSMRN